MPATKEKKSPAESRAQWDTVRRDILDVLDVKAEYERWGAVFTGDANDDGWVSCHAIGREDANPSAAVNVGPGEFTGRYKDFADPDGSLSFFYAAVKFGGYESPTKAIRQYAQRLGLKAPGGNDPTDWSRKLNFLRDQHTFRTIYASRKGGGINPDSLVRIGAQRAEWPKESPQPQSVYAIPVYGPNLTNSDPTGWVVIGQHGGPIHVWQGEGKPHKSEKSHTLKGSKSGLIGRQAVESLLAETVEVVWKVEGVSDCLALDSLIPDELRGKHVVITNSAGAMERPKPAIASLFAGLEVRVIHDADTPGQTGAAVWVQSLAVAGASVREVKLPYSVEEKHGKDLRDWISDGGTYAALCQMAEATPIAVVDKTASATGVNGSANGDGKAAFSDTYGDEQIISLIGLDVLGELDDGSIRVYSRYHHKVTDIHGSIDHLGYAKLLQICGPLVRDHVDESPAEGESNKATLKVVRQAIGTIAGKRRISEQSMLGQGLWPLSDSALVIVNGGEASVWNGAKHLEPSDSPLCRGQILDLSNTEPWTDFSRLAGYLEQAKSDAWREAVISECFHILHKWRWKNDDDPMVCCGLILATYVQSFLQWRPQVAILGESGAGKTTFFEFLGRLFGKLAIRGEKPTEAGLRQAVGNSSRAVILDEFEEDRHRQSVLELIRTSSRGESSAILRGSQDQRGRRFALRHICWVAAIEIGLKRDPDRNRFIHLELRKPEEDRRGKLEIPSIDECTELGMKLLAIAITVVWDARRVAKSLKTVKLPDTPDRVVESYAVPMAFCTQAFKLSEESARQSLEGMMKAQDIEEQSVSDHEELIDAIMGAHVPLGGGDRCMVSEVVFGYVTDQTRAGVYRILEGCGVSRVCSWKNGGCRAQADWLAGDTLFIRHTQVCSQLLRNSRWENQSINQILKRIPGASSKRRVIAGREVRGIDIPIAAIESGIQEETPDEY